MRLAGTEVAADRMAGMADRMAVFQNLMLRGTCEQLKLAEVVKLARRRWQATIGTASD